MTKEEVKILIEKSLDVIKTGCLISKIEKEDYERDKVYQNQMKAISILERLISQGLDA